MINKLLLNKEILKIVDNPIVKGIAAGAVTASLIAATTAFAPVGAVGAAGWYVVYGAAGGTALYETVKEIRKNKDKKD